MTLDRRLLAMTHEEPCGAEGADLTPVAPDLDEEDLGFDPEGGLTPANAPGRPARQMLNANPFRPGKYWGGAAPHCSLLPGGQTTISPDWQVSSPEMAPTKPTSPVPERVWLPMPKVLPCKMKPRVPKPVGPRLPMLRDEVRRLYNAASFKTWQNGWGFNTHISITARAMGFTDHAEFAALIPEMNKELQRWLGNGRNKERERLSRRCRPIDGQQHSYVYVVEYGYRHGLHAHELCVVPKELKKPFEQKVRDWWELKAGMALPDEAIHVRYAHKGSAYEQHRLQVIWFRYLIKSMAPGMLVRDCNGRVRAAEEVFKPWRKHTLGIPIGVPQLFGISRNLDRGAQAEAGFRSKFARGCVDELYDSSEVTSGLMRAFGLTD